MRILRNILITALTMLIVLTVVIYWATHSESASHWIVERSLNAASTEHQLEEFDGSLAKGFTIASLSMTLNNEDILQIDDVSTDWRFSLLQRSLEIHHVNIARVALTQKTKPTQEPSDDGELLTFEFSSPIKVIANSIQIDEFIIENEQQTIALQSIKTEFEMENSDLRIQEFRLKRDTTELESAASIKTQHPYNIDLEAKIADPTEKIEATLKIAGSISSYSIDGILQSETGLLPASNVQLHASSTMTSLMLDDLRLDSEAGDVVITGRVDWTNELAANVIINATQVDPGWVNQDIEALLDMSGNIVIAGDNHDVDLELAGTFQQEPFALIMHADGDFTQTQLSNSQLSIKENDLSFDGVVNWENETTATLKLSANDINLATLNTNVDGKLNLRGVIELAGDTHLSTINLDGVLNDQPVDIVLSLNGDKESVVITKATLSSEQSSINLSGGAKFDGPLSSDIELAIVSFNPALLKKELTGKIDGSGNLKINGSSLTTDVNLNGLLQNLPFELDLDVSSNQKNITINKATLLSDSGQLEVTGSANLNDVASADLILNGTNFNPEIFFPDYPGKLNLQGNLTLANNEIDTLINIDGEFRDYPIRATVDASGSATDFLINPTSITSGDNSLKLSGRVSRDGIQQLEWDLNAPQLAVVSADLNGLLKGSGKLNGDWNNIQGNSTLVGTELSYKDFSLAELNFNFQPDETNTQVIKLTAENIDLGQVYFDSLQLDGSGSLERQFVTVELNKSDGESFSTDIQSSKLPTGYEVTFSNTSISGKTHPTLKQNSPAILSAVNNSIALDDFCISGTTESICLSASNTEAELDSKLSIQSLPINRLTGWFGISNQVKDNLSGQLLASRRNSAWALDSQFSLDDGSALASKIQLDSKTKAISGSVNGKLNSVQWLGVFSEELGQAKGELDIDLSLSGTLEQPQLLGEVKAVNVSTNIPSLGISLKQLNVEATANQTGIATVTGEAFTGEGSIKIVGDIDYMPLQEWNLEFDIVGEKALLANLPESRVIASPNIQVKVSAKQISVDGEIEINQAAITLTDMPDKAIAVSDDTRIINQEPDVIAAKENTSLRADIKIVLGDEVTLKGQGLEVKLAGTLDISESNERATEANGTIYLSEGNYSAYGQKLSLDDGTLQFNGPINDPGISMRAERTIKSQTVGIQVGGTINKLTSEIYSEPVLSESDGISYLITGKPIGATGGSESATVLKALTNLGVKGSASIINDIRTSTGLSTLEIDGGDEIADTALLIGKYLSPQLYVQYVKKLFGENDSLQLRYEFNEKIQLEAETGTQQGIDLIYQVER